MHILKKTCEKLLTVKCSFCKCPVHANCVIEETPAITKAMIDVINSSDGAIFRCKLCQKQPLEPVKSTDLEVVTNKLINMEQQLSKLPGEISDSINIKLDMIKGEITACTSKINKVEQITISKCAQLVVENNSLRRQMNRTDIIISGIPSSTFDVYPVINKMFKVYNINLDPHDVNACFWINSKKAVLVKLNSLRKRDEFMKSYHLAHNLTLSQILETDIQSRVFVNDHLTPLASKLQFIGRKLLKSGKIKSFKLINTDAPKLKATLQDGMEKFFDNQQAELFMEGERSLEEMRE